MMASAEALIPVALAVLVALPFIYYLRMKEMELNAHRAKLEGGRAELERYASDLDNWDTALKTREVALNGLVRYADRLAALHPELMVQWVVLRREMFAGLDG